MPFTSPLRGCLVVVVTILLRFSAPTLSNSLLVTVSFPIPEGPDSINNVGETSPLELCLLFIANKTIGAIDTVKIKHFRLHDKILKSFVNNAD
ncbi:MAG: hypothetical protein LBF49_00115 [Puniceicoccales bacterium]|nr:hypothetical protein [Puniceicoccales bacterium]